MGEWTLPKLKKHFDAKDMTLNEAACIAGELLHENAVLDGELSTAQTECDELKKRCEKLEAQLTAEEQRAMESGGILSDVCDLVFDDPERAATHGYEGVKEKIVDLKNKVRFFEHRYKETWKALMAARKELHELRSDEKNGAAESSKPKELNVKWQSTRPSERCQLHGLPRVLCGCAYSLGSVEPFKVPSTATMTCQCGQKHELHAGTERINCRCGATWSFGQ